MAPIDICELHHILQLIQSSKADPSGIAQLRRAIALLTLHHENTLNLSLPNAAAIDIIEILLEAQFLESELCLLNLHIQKLITTIKLEDQMREVELKSLLNYKLNQTRQAQDYADKIQQTIRTNLHRAKITLEKYLLGLQEKINQVRFALDYLILVISYCQSSLNKIDKKMNYFLYRIYGYRWDLLQPPSHIIIFNHEHDLPEFKLNHEAVLLKLRTDMQGCQFDDLQELTSQQNTVIKQAVHTQFQSHIVKHVKNLQQREVYFSSSGYVQQLHETTHKSCQHVTQSLAKCNEFRELTKLIEVKKIFKDKLMVLNQTKHALEKIHENLLFTQRNIITQLSIPVHALSQSEDNHLSATLAGLKAKTYADFNHIEPLRAHVKVCKQKERALKRAVRQTHYPYLPASEQPNRWRLFDRSSATQPSNQQPPPKLS